MPALALRKNTLIYVDKYILIYDTMNLERKFSMGVFALFFDNL